MNLEASIISMPKSFPFSSISICTPGVTVKVLATLVPGFPKYIYKVDLSNDHIQISLF